MQGAHPGGDLAQFSLLVSRGLIDGANGPRHRRSNRAPLALALATLGLSA
jgi:hypothetical protein